MNVRTGDHPRWGTGSLGDVVLSSNVTLTGDVEYDNLDMNGHDISGPYLVRVRGTLSNGGGACAIRNDGPAAVTVNAGNPGSAGSLAVGGVGGSGAGSGGGNGGASVGVADSWVARTLGGTGGDGTNGGGSGGAQSGGVGGNCTAPAESRGLSGASVIEEGRAADGTPLRGGCGGAGGATQAGAGAFGGAGGAGGGARLVLARVLGAGADTITISANGGAGGNATAGSSAGCGGGAGGTGGWARLVYERVAVGGGIPTLSASGGAGGAGTGAGANGSAGGAGVTEIVQIREGGAVGGQREVTQPWDRIAVFCEIVIGGVGQTGLTVEAVLRRRGGSPSWYQSGGGWGASPSTLTLTAIDAVNLPGMYAFELDPDDLDPNVDGRYIAQVTEASFDLLETVVIYPVGTADESRQTYSLRQGAVRVVATDHDSQSGQPTEGTLYTYPTPAAVAADTGSDGTGSIGTYEFEATFTSGKLDEYVSRRTS